jgi:hypothetical protein
MSLVGMPVVSPVVGVVEVVLLSLFVVAVFSFDLLLHAISNMADESSKKVIFFICLSFDCIINNINVWK